MSFQDIFIKLASNYHLQENLLRCTINSSINLQHPVKISYQISFLKEIISSLEKQNAEIHDDIYTTYGRLMALSNQEQYFYKHYILKDSSKQISLKESASLISKGTTGLRTWQVNR